MFKIYGFRFYCFQKMSNELREMMKIKLWMKETWVRGVLTVEGEESVKGERSVNC